MTELERALTAESAAASPQHILEGIDDALAHRETTGATHTIYAELWHITFWQQVTLDWIAGVETPIPHHASDGFPNPEQTHRESFAALKQRFFHTLEAAVSHAREATKLDRDVRCPSPPGKPVRIMSVRDQLISLAAHNAYHFGRVVLLRQIAGAWPPPSGGYTW